MPAPHEVVAAPLTIWVADVGSSFPDIDDPEASMSPWTKLGTSGDLNYSDAGVTVNHGEETEDFTPAGSTMPMKRFRTAESFLISLELVDVSPEAYAQVMNDATITTVSPADEVAGQKHFSLYRGDQVNQFAVIAKGMSSVDNDLALQYEFSKAFISVNGDIVWNKGTPAFLPVEILAVKTADADVIRLRIQTAAST